MLAPPPEPEPEWRTGRAIDEYTPIYLALAKRSDRHPQMTPEQVDRLSIPMCALLMGVGIDHEANDLAELAELARRRAAGEDVTWT